MGVSETKEINAMITSAFFRIDRHKNNYITTFSILNMMFSFFVINSNRLLIDFIKGLEQK